MRTARNFTGYPRELRRRRQRAPPMHPSPERRDTTPVANGAVELPPVRGRLLPVTAPPALPASADTAANAVDGIEGAVVPAVPSVGPSVEEAVVGGGGGRGGGGGDGSVVVVVVVVGTPLLVVTLG